MDLQWLAAACVISVTFVLHLLLNFNSWWHEPRLKVGQAPLPPGNLGWPVFGNMSAFLRAFKSDDPDGFIRHYTNKFACADLYKAFLFWQPSVLATTPEACKFVLCNDSLFETGWPASAKRLNGMQSFVGLTGKEHLKLRRLTEPAINSPKALQQIVPRIAANIQKSLRNWSLEMSTALIIEMRKFTFGTFCEILFGEQSSVNVDELAPHFSQLNYGMRALPINLPGTAFHKALKARRTIEAYLQKIINETRSCNDDIGMVSLLLRDETGKPTHDSQVIDMLVMFMNGGHESTALLIAWIMILLHRNPSVYEKLKAEQQEFSKERLPGELLTYWDIKRMSYLSRVIDETLRLVSISPIVFRRAIQDTEYKGFTVPKGWHALAWLRQLHMDPRLHPDPHRFDPERWLKQPPQSFSFLPFGLGTRTCPGNELAKMQASVVIHYMITGYELKPLNPDCKIQFLPHPMPVDYYPVQVRESR